MKKKITYLFYVLFALMAIWSIATLSFSPIAWFDEVYFASTTHSFMNGNGLSLELDHCEPVLMYGPIYFLLTSSVMKLFGFGILQFRVVNLLFAFFSVLLLGKILSKLNVSKGMNYFFQILMLTDTLFVANSHSGRMEFVALFFILAAYWIYLNHFNREVVKALLVSILLTLAVLTTLRVVVICIPIAIAQLMKFIKSRSWDGLVVYCLIPIILYGIWVFVAFGSVSGMVSYFTQAPADGSTQESLFERFAKGNWLIAKYHYPLVLAALFSIAYLSIKGKIKDIVVFLTPIILYYFLVKDTGLYGVLVLPFYMIIIALGLTEMGCDYRKAFHISYKTILALCMFVNCSIFAVKAYSVISTKERRNPRLAAEWIKDNIPYGSKVAGDYPFYYAAIDNGCQFKRIFRERVKNEVVLDDVLSNYRPDYIVIGKNRKDSKMLSLIKKAGFEELTSIDFENDQNLFLGRWLEKLNFKITATYEGSIYANIGNNIGFVFERSENMEQ